MGALIGLSRNCYQCKEFLIGYKVLRCAYKLANGYIFPSFVNVNYLKKQRKYRRKYERMRCRHCDKHMVDLKCCSLCMKVVYCSKKCQKIDWKQEHRKECDKSWQQTYPLLRDEII